MNGNGFILSCFPPHVKPCYFPKMDKFPHTERGVPITWSMNCPDGGNPSVFSEKWLIYYILWSSSILGAASCVSRQTVSTLAVQGN